MNDQEIINKLCDTLSGNLLVPYSGECLSKITNGEIVLNSAPDVKVNHAINIYSQRFQIQNDDINNSNHRVLGYPFLLKQLSEETSDMVRIITIATEEGSYVIFCSIDINRIIAIIKTPLTSSRVRLLKQEYDSRNIETSISVFSKKVKI